MVDTDVLEHRRLTQLRLAAPGGSLEGRKAVSDNSLYSSFIIPVAFPSDFRLPAPSPLADRLVAFKRASRSRQSELSDSVWSVTSQSIPVIILHSYKLATTLICDLPRVDFAGGFPLNCLVFMLKIAA